MTDEAGRQAFPRETREKAACSGKGTGDAASATAPRPQAHHALLLGDWGWEGDTSGQAATARAMATYAETHLLKIEALFLLGDNWYGPMPGGVKDRRWKTQFEDMYPESVFACPVYPVLGNHDYERKPAGVFKAAMELEYAQVGFAGGATRWTQPGLWYACQFPAQEPLMTVLLLDSNVPHAPEPVDGIECTLTAPQYDEQMAWLKHRLSEPRTTPFLMVIAHHPIFSNGPHGDHARLVADWAPLLAEAGVHVYFAGHDHDLQHLELAGHPTSFVCSGAGGADLYDLRVPAVDRGPYAEKVYGFTHLEITPELVVIRHIAADGTLVHSFSKDTSGTVRLGVQPMQTGF